MKGEYCLYDLSSAELIIDSDRIEIRTPLNKTLEDTRKIVRSKAEWIIRKQEQLKSLVPEIIKPRFEENSTLPYLGNNCPLRIEKNQSRNNLTFVNREFIVDITGSKIDDNIRSLIKHLYEEWIMGIAYSILRTKVESYSQKLGVEVQKILVKDNLKSRWASLTRKGSINFNMHLIKAPHYTRIWRNTFVKTEMIIFFLKLNFILVLFINRREIMARR